MPGSSRYPLPSRGFLAVACAIAMLGKQLTPQDEGARSQSAAETRAAVLRAMVVLKLAPYLVADAPAAGRKQYRIGIVGSDPVATAMLQELPGKKVGDLPVVVVAVDAADAVKGNPALTCDLLWIATSVDAATQQRILTAQAARPIVLVNDQPGFVAMGGSVQLFVQDNGVKFEVNSESLKAKGMRASPQLQKLSRKGPTQ